MQGLSLDKGIHQICPDRINVLVDSGGCYLCLHDLIGLLGSARESSRWSEIRLGRAENKAESAWSRHPTMYGNVVRTTQGARQRDVLPVYIDRVRY